MIDKILSRPEFQTEPPVLVDIGASGQLHGRWKAFAKYAVCIAFDADDRDFGYVESESGHFRKLYTFNNIVTGPTSDEDENTGLGHADFYLTVSPHCSSLLRPRPDLIQEYAFAPKFEPTKVVQLKTRSLRSTLDSLNIKQVDWFKTDSQGTDLRLFRNLGEARAKQVLTAEFEPGIASIYDGEDKLYQVLQFMEATGSHWLAELIPKGSPRITPALLDSFTSQPLVKKFVLFSLKNSAVWGEMTYLNRFADETTLTQRNLLLGWVFATTLKQHGFALILTQKAKNISTDPIFAEMEAYSRRRIWGRVFGLGFWPEVVKKFDKLLGR
ncbi:hypothetical protein [Spirosoma radiotolerans]|uniref:Methyltransferase FkbM domain-containing protein n=1 Tax=Spirosoma radiotolerans TaxID=1379870 RepID=A0A0E3V577_9BACT|nr:hypothetical protein [Spirosoma radiotolerans]AKD53937.1 hypothetical protein SD10_02480 [Spirosoma radiotolerans]